MTGNPSDPKLGELERVAADATRAGRQADAARLWSQVLAVAPDHLAALTQVAQAAYRAGDWQAALALFRRAAEVDPRNPRRWVNLAMTLERVGDDGAEETALFKALALEPRDLMALLLRGRLFERQGRSAKAAAAYGAAAAVAPAPGQLPTDLQSLLGHALTYSDRHRAALASFLDERMDPALRDCAGADVGRFRLSLDIMLGRKRRHDPQPLSYYYPGLEPMDFFDRADFPWLDAIEAGTDVIRNEFLAVLEQERQPGARPVSGAGFSPYIQYSADLPVDQWATLNHNPDWSVLHLVKSGSPVVENAVRCPETMRLWSAHVPAPGQSGRTPVALFSLLRPHTHIPPHHGASNVRLLAHLPLIVPPGCRFRVGNSVRDWVPGRALVFDDTIEHEAWNDSDHLRVVLIFDHWHPGLSAEERHLIGALNEALNEFGASSGDAGDAGGYAA